MYYIYDVQPIQNCKSYLKFFLWNKYFKNIIAVIYSNLSVKILN